MTEGVTIRAYREAAEFHRKRTTLLAGDFYSRELDAVRPRAMTVTGLTKFDALIAVTSVIDRGIASNRTTSDIADEIGEIVKKHGGTILPGSRIELIVHNALYTANAGGEWKAAMEFVEDRPNFRYIGPDDDRNSAICDALRGLIVHYTDPVLKHLWHPNHHWERHRWETLGRHEVNERNVYRSPEGFEYPVINGQIVRPADGWDFNAADAMGADDKVFIESARKLGEQIARKTPRDYGLGPIVEVDPDEFSPMPRLANPVPQAALERAWQAFQRTIGIENGSGVFVLDYASDGVRINRDSFDLALTDAQGNFAGGNGRYFPLILPTLRDPFETWLVPFATGRGTTFIKRYIGVFTTERGMAQTIVLDRTDDGWLWQMIAPRDVEAYRKGLLIRSRVRKGGDT